MPKTIEFEYDEPLSGKSHLRVTPRVYADVAKIADQCRMPIAHVASRLLQHALQDVVLKPRPLYDLTLEPKNDDCLSV